MKEMPQVDENSGVVLMNCGFSGENVDFRSPRASDCFRLPKSKTEQPQSERESPQLPVDDFESHAPGELDAVSSFVAVSTKPRRTRKYPLVGLAVLPLLFVLLRHADSSLTQSGQGKTTPITSQ